MPYLHKTPDYKIRSREFSYLDNLLIISIQNVLRYGILPILSIISMQLILLLSKNKMKKSFLLFSYLIISSFSIAEIVLRYEFEEPLNTPSNQAVNDGSGTTFKK